MSDTALDAPDETHDPALRSSVASANDPGCDFPIQNLPFCAFRTRATDPFRIGIGIGDQILDVSRAGWSIVGVDEAIAACRAPTLNTLMALPRHHRRALRRAVSTLLSKATIQDLSSLLVPMAAAEYGMPADIRGFTDFYASIFHATNAGRLIRPDNPLLPNYKYIPVGYNGRASSIGLSGSTIRRPSGQVMPAGAATPVVRPSARLDYEAELGFLIGRENALGAPVPIDRAGDHLFGVCLLNDWSARDLQVWEYQPLGPFLAKSFATTISPWIVTMEALAPFRVPAFQRDAQDPAPLPHLADAADARIGGLDVRLDTCLQTAAMQAAGTAPQSLGHATSADLYWTAAQMIAHHTSNGCRLERGDLLGSGTISGPAPENYGSLLELTWGGSLPVSLQSGETRTYLEDGDTVIMRGTCARDGFARIGFGECRATIVPSI